MEVRNDIKVLYSRYSEKIIVDTTEEGRIVLFNHNNILETGYGVFTGIAFDLASNISYTVADFAGNTLQTFYGPNACLILRIDDDKNYDEPCALVTFGEDIRTHNIFKGHLIEIKK